MKTGTARMTHVKAIRNRPKYSPVTDYYRGLREAIVEFHQNGSTDGAILDKAVKAHRQTHTGSKCPERLEAYRRFLGRKKVIWFEPPRAEWKFDDLVVRMNPELGLKWNGTVAVVKLYWKEDKLTKRQVETILFMMHSVLGPLVPPNTQMSILDIPSAHLISAPVPGTNLTPLLRAEATSFIELWKSLGDLTA